MRRVLAVGVTALVCALAPATPALAVQVTCGQTISQSTKVSNNLENCPSGGLRIDTSNITLDLRGHTIDGDDSGNGDGILIQSGLENVIVKNGTVRQFRDGLSVQNDGDGHRLLSLRLADNTQDGVEIDGGNTDALFRSILAIGNDDAGFNFDAGGGGTSGLVFQRTTAKDNANIGYDIQDLDDALIERSSARGNGGEGVVVDSASAGGLIRDFVTQDNGGRGVAHNGSGWVLLRISAVGNDEEGITVGDPAADTKLVNSSWRRNGFDGILVDAGATGTLLTGNLASANQGDGIDVDSPNTALRRNTANDNGAFGIDAVAGVTDLGGNRAKGNGDPQCANVNCS